MSSLTGRHIAVHQPTGAYDTRPACTCGWTGTDTTSHADADRQWAGHAGAPVPGPELSARKALQRRRYMGVRA